MTTLGTTVRRLREEMGLTQRELAQRLDVNASHVSHIESNRRDPSLDLLRRLADELSVWPGLLLAAFVQVELPEEFQDLYEGFTEEVRATTHSDQLPLPLES